ncbi:enhanced intracellular survival protein Eis [Lysinibacillus sp. SGAir0095]|uniref:GNAT family N-acetyltransferase n=1 Tax=Lysinibacillus sp. SGAir0095 TaxID=2070463 RepID=UPI0010CD6526|nr:GNAT family N-acetyltransferase [Lysinibacillus sp. SGAir0095]QCR31897.1 GNAT family N-acetyltransferase [Lysinibacillus sp. SGAir0095]
MNPRKGLVMREIRMDEMAKSIDLLNYVFQMSMSIKKDRTFVSEKSRQFNVGHALGWFDGDHLVSQILSLPFQVNVYGVPYEMGGITAIGTYPEYSKQGLMDKLIKETLTVMRSEKRYISYLFPFSIPYYRKKGWEIMSDIVEFQVKDTQFPNYMELPGQIRRVDTRASDVVSIYEQYASRTHGAMIRNTIAWNEKFHEDYWEEKFVDTDVQLQAAVYYNEDDEPQGYIYYRIMEENFYIDEIVYLQEEARKGLWNFVSAHKSMVYNAYGKTAGNEPVAFLLEDSEIIQKVSPYFMARIVDVEKFLETYPFDEPNFHIRFTVTDRLVEWNNGTYDIKSEDWKLKITKLEQNDREDLTVQMSIQTLTTMLLGYKRPKYLEKIERVKGAGDTVAVLEDILPVGIPTFIDYF